MRRTVLTALVAAVVSALVSIPVGVMAAGSFTDVPDSNVFKADIDWLAQSGVTKGCNPPDNTLFCPSDNVTREQMAAFMHRLAVNQVVDAGSIDGLDSEALVQKAETIDLPQPMTNWVPLGDSPPTARYLLGGTSVEFVVTADGDIGLGLTAPSVGDGTEYRLTNVTVCIAGLSPGNAYVDRVLVMATGFEFSDFNPLVTSGCVSYPMDVSPNKRPVVLTLHLGGGSNAILRRVDTTWSAP